MDPQTVLSAFDEQVRRSLETSVVHQMIEQDSSVIRLKPTGPGWAGVIWSDLRPDGSDADAVIAAEIDRFADLAGRGSGSSIPTTNRLTWAIA